MIQDEIAKRIRLCLRYHKRHGIAPATLARKAGLSDAVVSKLYAGKNMPSALTIIKLCKALNVSADFLLGIPKPARPKAVRRTNP